MSAIRRRTRAFLGLPAPDDATAMKRPRVVPWLAAPAAFAVALGALVALGAALETALNGQDNWQVNAPAIAGLTAVLLLAPSSPTQPRARNAWVAAIVGLAVVGAGYGVAVVMHEPGTTYSPAAFLTGTAGALAGCVAFAALTRVNTWTVAMPATSAAEVAADSTASGDPTSAGATEDADASPADT